MKNRRRNKKRTKIKIMQIDIFHLEKKNAKKVKTRKEVATVRII